MAWLPELLDASLVRCNGAMDDRGSRGQPICQGGAACVAASLSDRLLPNTAAGFWIDASLSSPNRKSAASRKAERLRDGERSFGQSVVCRPCQVPRCPCD